MNTVDILSSLKFLRHSSEISSNGLYENSWYYYSKPALFIIHMPEMPEDSHGAWRDPGEYTLFYKIVNGEVRGISFENFLDELDPDAQAELLFHLDVFS